MCVNACLYLTHSSPNLRMTVLPSTLKAHLTYGILASFEWFLFLRYTLCSLFIKCKLYMAGNLTSPEGKRDFEWISLIFHLIFFLCLYVISLVLCFKKLTIPSYFVSISNNLIFSYFLPVHFQFSSPLVINTCISLCLNISVPRMSIQMDSHE